MTKTVSKENVSSLRLDIDVDKYYLAYDASETADKRLRYFSLSLSNFPGQEYQHTINLTRSECIYALVDQYLPMLKGLKKVMLKNNLITLDNLRSVRLSLPGVEIVCDDANSLVQDMRSAALRGNVEEIKKLIGLGADGRQVMYYSFIRNIDIAKYLVSLYPDMKFPMLRSVSRLMIFALIGDLDGMKKELVNTNEISRTNASGWNALMYAAWQGNAEAVRLLLNSGASLHKDNNCGMSPLMLYAAAGMFDECRAEIVKGEDINTVDRWGKTALTWAATVGQAGIIRLLAEKGADVNRRDSERDDVTMFMCRQIEWAVLSGNLEAVREMVNAGAAINTKNWCGPYEGAFISPLALASFRGYSEIFTFLVSSGADLYDYGAPMPLIYYASYGRNLEIIKLLVSKKMSVNTFHDGTPLTASTRSGAADIVEYLIGQGADVNVRGWGGTALAIALANGHYKCANLLKSAGAIERFDETSSTEKLTLLTNGRTKYPGFDYYQHLDLGGTDITDQVVLNTVCGFTDLKSLSFSNCSGLKMKTIVDCLRALTNLTSIILDGCRVDDTVIKRLPRADVYENLSLNRTDISDNTLSYLATSQKNLKKLAANYTKITDSGLVKIKNLTNCEQLTVASVSISDQSFKTIAPALSRLTRLNLQGTLISDASIELLTKYLTNLNYLEIVGSGASAKSILALMKNHPRLYMINGNRRWDGQTTAYYKALNDQEKKEDLRFKTVDFTNSTAFGAKIGQPFWTVFNIYVKGLLKENKTGPTNTVRSYDAPCFWFSVSNKLISTIVFKPCRIYESPLQIGAEWSSVKDEFGEWESGAVKNGMVPWAARFGTHVVIVEVAEVNGIVMGIRMESI